MPDTTTPGPFALAAAGTPVKLSCGCDDYGTGCQSPALHRRARLAARSAHTEAITGLTNQITALTNQVAEHYEALVRLANEGP